MRILELEVTDIRGIRRLTLRPDGENLVVYGRNGTGKSGVVDAIDFLLTGSMSRLHGLGTGDISINHHGPHIDSADDSAQVRAVVQLPAVAEPVQIARSLSNPSMIECDEEVRPQVKASLDVAQRGQHLLTRRDLLRFIASGSATRAQGIQDLLNLASVEGTRRSLVTAKNQISAQKRAAEAALSRANQSLSTVTGILSL